MEEEPVQAIRGTIRNQLLFNRRRQKDEETDVRRSLANLSLNLTNVAAVASKLKTKALVSISELISLQNALIDDPKNIEVVLNTHGALRGLVRELTGHDVKKQIASCGCLCNLALGDSRACCTVAKAAGVYLIASLDSLTTQLAVTCAWTLGNLAGSGTRACDVIIAQGAVTKLCDVTNSSEMQEGAISALTQLAYLLRDELAPNHLHKIVESLSQTDLNTDSSYLLFILSCHTDFTAQTLPEHYLNKILQKLPVSIENHLNVCKNTTTNDKQTCCDFVYLVRVLANVNNSSIYSGILEYFVSNDLVGCVRRLLGDDEERSFWWLLGNMLNCCGDHVFFMQLINDV